jgi:hypothetical protein
MSTPADIDFRVFVGEVIEPPSWAKGHGQGTRGEAGSGIDEPETRVNLMDTMYVDAMTIRPATAVADADARETTRALLEAL